MQTDLAEIIDYVWDLADVAIEYGQVCPKDELSNSVEHVVDICGLQCTFVNMDIVRLKADNMDLRLFWRSFRNANDNQDDEEIDGDSLPLPCGMFASEIFPESSAFLSGSMEDLEKWHADIMPLRGSLVA